MISQMNIPTIFTQPENFYSLACYTYILSGVICGVVRWFHMCHPFDRGGDFFYPARRQMTFFYTATALQLPYVLCPGDPGTWLFARSFGILYYPICFTILYHRYFQTDKPWRQWSAVTYFVTPFLLLGGLLFIVFFHQNNLLIPYKLTWEIAMGGVSILLSIHLFKECKWLIKKVDSYHTQNYSNESDFPFAFAKKILHLPALGLLMMWTLFILDNQMVKAYIDLFMATWQVQFLCRILHPNKMIHSEQNKNNMDFIENENMEQILQEKELFEKIVQTTDGQVLEEAPIDDTSDEPKLITYNKEKLRLQMEQENWESVKDEVLTIVSKRYLEPSLKRIEVVRDVSSMNHTLAGTFITQVGFYRLVNAFRIRHYERLMASDSSANIGQEAAAELCGFKNRWGLTNARKRLKDFDYDLIEKYVS
nr:hypothetical protein [Prevotella sp.]